MPRLGGGRETTVAMAGVEAGAVEEEEDKVELLRLV